MVNQGQSRAPRYPARYPEYDPQRDTPTQPGTRPWRQWHTSARPAQTSPLDVSAPKRPQWGRFVYLAIILIVAAAIAKVIFGYVFWYNASGIVAGQQYTVSATQPATVEKVLVQPSEQVHAGQVLALLNSPQLKQELIQKKAHLAQVKHQVSADSIANKLASLRAKKQSLQSQIDSLHLRISQQKQQLHALAQLVAHNAASAGDLTRLRTELAKLQAQYDQAQAKLASVRTQLGNVRERKQALKGNASHQRVAALRKEYKQLRHKLHHLSLTAPASGQVAQIKVSKGSVLQPGEQAFVIVSGEAQRAYLYFPPAVQDRLHKGMKLSVTTPDGNHVPMHITSIYPSLQAAPITTADKRFDSPKVVVAAKPTKGKQLPKALHPGTPVSSRIPRWDLPIQWFQDLKHAFL